MAPMAVFTNDDGIDSPLLTGLARALGDVFEPAVVAPAQEMSWASAMHVCTRPVTVEPTAAAGLRAWRVTGSPVDCVHLAVQHLGLAPAVLFSGANFGLNAGASRLAFSGTVQAALAATRLGVPAVAVSIYYPRPVRTQYAHVQLLPEELYRPELEAAASLIRRLWHAGCLSGRACVNLNLPHPSADPGTARYGRVWDDGNLTIFEEGPAGTFTAPACYPEFRGVPEDTDMGLVGRGLIAVSSLAMTHEDGGHAARVAALLGSGT